MNKEKNVRRMIAELIISERKEKNMTQEQLSEATGISQGIISRLENGGYNPSVEYLSRIGKALNKDLVIFYSNEEDSKDFPVLN